MEVQINASERKPIPAGVRIHLIQASRGSYIRTPDGKFFAVRQSSSISENNSKISTMPPPPPSLSANPIDQFLFSKILKSTNDQNLILFYFRFLFDGSINFSIH